MTAELRDLPQVRAGTHRDGAPVETPHGGRKPPKNQEGAGTGTEARRKRAPRQTPRPTPRKGIPGRGVQRRPTPTERRTTPGGAPANTHRRSKHRTPYRSLQRTPTSHRKPHGGWRAHLHGENEPDPQRRPQGTPPHGAPPHPHRQATTPATTRATSQATDEDEGTATATRARDQDPQRTRDQGTGPQGGQPHGRLPNPPARAARPGPHSTDSARHPHLTAPPSHQPATLRPALRTTTQARLTLTDPPRHNARPRHTAPQRPTVQRATARRDATRHRAAQHGTTDPNLKNKRKPATAHPGRRRTSTPHSGAAGHTRGHHVPGNNGGGPPRRLKPVPQRRKDTNNPSPLTQSHTQPPGAAAQPAEPGPNLAGRGAERNMYIAHPTHGAGTRPNRTQPPTAARKTTLNAGQCVRQPREGRRRNRQAPPPQKKTGRGGGGGGNSRQPAKRPPTPQEAAKPPTQKAPKTGPPKRHRGTSQPKPATPSQEQRPIGERDTETCRYTPKKKKKEPAAQPERKGMGGQGPQGPGQGHPTNDATKPKKKAQKTDPDNPAKKGGAQPRPGPSTHAHTAHRNRKRRGASGARTRPHTSQKQAET